MCEVDFERAMRILRDNEEEPKPVRKGRSRAERREEERSRQLDRRVPDRVCPQCGKRKLKSRQWVILISYDRRLSADVRKVGAICLGCYRSA